MHRRMMRNWCQVLLRNIPINYILLIWGWRVSWCVFWRSIIRIASFCIPTKSPIKYISWWILFYNYLGRWNLGLLVFNRTCIFLFLLIFLVTEILFLNCFNRGLSGNVSFKAFSYFCNRVDLFGRRRIRNLFLLRI